MYYNDCINIERLDASCPSGRHWHHTLETASPDLITFSVMEQGLKGTLDADSLASTSCQHTRLDLVG